MGSAPFAQVEDSGSLILDVVTMEPVALLFAVGQGLTFASPIDKILGRFGVAIVPDL